MIPLDPMTGRECGWHRAQRPRWAALERAGWKFSPTTMEIVDTVSIVMSRGARSLACFVSAAQPAEEIHARLLALCEETERAS